MIAQIAQKSIATAFPGIITTLNNIVVLTAGFS
jgi:hypothetical protein